MYSNRHTLERKTTKCDHCLCALYDYEDFGSIKNHKSENVYFLNLRSCGKQGMEKTLRM